MALLHAAVHEANALKMKNPLRGWREQLQKTDFRGCLLCKSVLQNMSFSPRRSEKSRFRETVRKTTELHARHWLHKFALCWTSLGLGGQILFPSSAAERNL